MDIWILIEKILNTMDRLTKKTIENIKKEKQVSLLNILIITFTLLFLSIFLNVFLYTQTSITNLAQRAQIYVYFKDSVSEARIIELKDFYFEDERVSNIEYIDKTTAYENYKSRYVENPELLEYLNPGVFPASLNVSTYLLEDLTVLFEEFSIKDEVEDVTFYRSAVEEFSSWVNRIYLVSIVLLTYFVILSILIINLDLKLTVMRKREEIAIMKLVGATRAFIKKPLVLQGIFYGVVSGFISGLLTSFILIIFYIYGIQGTYLYLSFIPQLGIHYIFYIIFNFVLNILLGFAFGSISSNISINKYVKTF
jgi:cell division transport system permease protein